MNAVLPFRGHGPCLQPVEGAHGWSLLRDLCARTQGADPFCRSQGYFAMTGRKGLWVYGDQATQMVIARHPNRADRLLLFPPVGPDEAGLVNAALADRTLPEGIRQLARISPKERGLVAQFERSGMLCSTQEDVLDWAFPVHVISTEAVVRRQGKTFNNLRGHVNRAARLGLFCEALDPARHGSDVAEVAGRWARSKDFAGFSHEDLIGPGLACLRLMHRGVGQLGGVMIYTAERQPIGYWIWDELANGSAASLVRVSTAKRQGAAEFAAVAVAETLHGRGITRLCLGGSETKSLDEFKRKLGAVRSIGLETLTFCDAPRLQGPRLVAAQ